MTKLVLDVGQCGPDHSSICRLLDKNFEVEIHQAHSGDDAMKLAQIHSFDLILINRILDADHSPGINVLCWLKSDPATATTPVMVISNYPDAQESAVTAGAVSGFGKSELRSLETLSLLQKYLAE